MSLRRSTECQMLFPFHLMLVTELTVTCNLLVSCHRTADLHCRPIFLHKEKNLLVQAFAKYKEGDFT